MKPGTITGNFAESATALSKGAARVLKPLANLAQKAKDSASSAHLPTSVTSKQVTAIFDSIRNMPIPWDGVNHFMMDQSRLSPSFTLSHGQGQKISTLPSITSVRLPEGLLGQKDASSFSGDG